MTQSERPTGAELWKLFRRGTFFSGSNHVAIELTAAEYQKITSAIRSELAEIASRKSQFE